MPTLLTESGLRFYFWSNEGDPLEPPHVHVKSAGGGAAKFWLDPVSFDSSTRMNRKDLKRAFDLVQEHAKSFKERWDEHFKA